MKLKTNLVELHELEHLDLKTTNKDGKRYYTDGEETFYYPSVTSVTGLLSSDQIKLWRKRVGEETANKITAQATKRGTNFHQIVEDYLRKEKEFIEFDNVLQEGMFKAMQPVLDDIIPISLEAPLFSNVLQMAGRVDCVGIYDDVLQIIDFKTSAKFKEEYMAKPWFIQMTAYAMMVEEMTGYEVEEILAIVVVEGQTGGVQAFGSFPNEHVDELVSLRKQYTNLYGV